MTGCSPFLPYRPVLAGPLRTVHSGFFSLSLLLYFSLFFCLSLLLSLFWIQIKIVNYWYWWSLHHLGFSGILRVGSVTSVSGINCGRGSPKFFDVCDCGKNKQLFNELVFFCFLFAFVFITFFFVWLPCHPVFSDFFATSLAFYWECVQCMLICFWSFFGRYFWYVAQFLFIFLFFWACFSLNAALLYICCY